MAANKKKKKKKMIESTPLENPIETTESEQIELEQKSMTNPTSSKEEMTDQSPDKVDKKPTVNDEENNGTIIKNTEIVSLHQETKSVESETSIQPKKKKKLFRKIFAGFLVISILISAVVGTVAIKIGMDMIEASPEMKVEDFMAADSSRMLDKDGNVIAELGAYLRQNISFNDMPQSLVDAFISIEDSRYYEHHGFDIPRFTKALIENVIDSLEAKRLIFGQGGSTFSMQLVKNTYFTIDDIENSVLAEKKIDRKVQEIHMALNLEKIISKEAIFELYINKLNFGGNIRGVQKAALYYFGKDASHLSLSESALLAGIVNRPNAYNPYENLDYATSRRNTVLDMMAYHGYITEKETALAKSIKIEDQLVGENFISNRDGYSYQSYIDAAINEVITLTGRDPALTPMIIHTNMDQNVQSVVDQIQAGEIEDIEFLDDLMQIAIVCMNNQTGEIVALGGGRNYEGARMFNRATDMYKQPGSSVKPFISYALAFEHLGWATSHMVVDRPIVYRGTSKVIKNFDGKYRGDLTLEEAICTSMNTPAIQTLQDVVDTVGRDLVIQYLNDLGFNQVNSNNFDLGYAIGGSSYTVTPIQMTAAQAVLVNEGKYNTPHTVSKIEFLDGSDPIVFEPEEKQVLSPETAYMVSSIMEKCVSGPYINYMQILRRSYPVYAKTGTSDWGRDGLQYGIPQGASKDKWMISSTSEYTTTVWFGYDKGIKDAGTYFNATKNRLNTPGRISSLLLDTLNTPEDPPSAIKRPENVVNIQHILGTFTYANGAGFEYLYTDGLIKKENAEVISIYNTAPTTMNGINIYRNEDGSASIVWNADGFEPVNEDGLKDISLYKGSIQVNAWGRQLFSYGWVLGQPHYIAHVFVNGNYVTDVYSNNGYGWVWLEGEGSLRVCGYYYTDSGITSNEVCSS